MPNIWKNAVKIKEDADGGKKKSAIEETNVKANVNCLKFFPSFFEVKLTNSVHACSWTLSNSSTPWTAAYQVPLFMEFSRQENWHVCVPSCFSHVWLFMTPWTVACQVPLSMDFSRQEYWTGLPFPPSRNFPYPGIEPMSWFSCIGKQTLYH